MKFTTIAGAITTGALALPMVGITAAPAHAAPSAVAAAPTSVNDCDGYSVVGRFREVKSGASFKFHGRKVELQNESIFDTYSRAEIKKGRKRGDRVWVDRSYRQFGSTHGIVSKKRAEAKGWKRCGPFSRRTQSVYNDDYAARACARIDRKTRCGKWYVD